MKLHEITEGKITDEDRHHIRQSLGGRPEKFKYNGPPKIWVHWAEVEDLDELMERWDELKHVEEFCVSSPGAALVALSGLVFEGKPRFYFPFDVSSTYDPKTGLRAIMNKADMEKKPTALIARQLGNDVGDNERETHDEAWVNPNEVKLIGVVTASYGQSFEQLTDPNSEDGPGQLGTMIDVIEDVHDHNLKVFFAAGKRLQEVTRDMLVKIQAVVQRAHHK